MKHLIQITTIILFVLAVSVRLSAQVGINNGSISASGSAMLDITSSDKGLLIPRMTSQRRDLIPSPAAGLMIYNTTTNQFNYFNGNNWFRIETTFVSSVTGSLSTGGGVAISAQPNPVPDNSAMLDANDPDRGFLLTRTTPQAIASPENGLIIFDSQAGDIKYFYDGLWYPVCAVTTGVTGATGTQPSVGVAISTSNLSPHPSAIVDVVSPNKGILIPRLTNAQRDLIAPATGLTIFNTTAKAIEYFTGTGWLRMNTIVPAGVSITASELTVCAGVGVTFTATPVNGGTTPGFQWRVNSTNISGATNATFTYPPAHNDLVTCVMTSSLTCVSGSPATSNGINMTVIPVPPVSITITPSGNPVCEGTQVIFSSVIAFGGTAPAYQWFLNSQPVSGATNPTFTHTAVNGDQVRCFLTSNATCAPATPISSNLITMTVNPLLPVSITIAPGANPVCAGTQVTFTSNVVNGGTAPAYQWYLNNLPVNGATGAAYSRITLNNDAVRCQVTSNAVCPTGNPATSNTVTMTVNPLLPASVTIAAVPAGPVCNGTSVTFTATPVNGGTSPAYQWRNGTNPIPGATNATYTSSTLANGNVITVQMTSNATPCLVGSPAISNSVTMTVYPLPGVNPVNNITHCNGVITSVVAFSSPVSGATYAWTNNTPSIGLAASGNGNLPSFTATNGTTSPVTATITVIASANGCSGAPMTFTITVNPTPTVNPVNNGIFCNNEPVASTVFSGPVAGTTFTWTNNTPSIGLAASGSGDLPSFITVNNTTAMVVATITVTPLANGCTGTPISFTISVYPTPTVNAVSNKTHCNGATTPVVPFSGPVAGTLFHWTNDNPAIGLAASGSGDIPSFTATNTGVTPITANITVNPVINGCQGIALAFTITVYPTATVTPVNNAEYCNGTATQAVSFSGPVAGTTFAWTNNTPTIGLPASGNGTIPVFTATNNSTATVTATITVTPTANGCTGTPVTFTITVFPTPTVNAVANAFHCNGATSPLIPLTGPVNGSTFAWSNSDPSIGLGASGTGDIPSFTATNTGTAPVTATITIVPEANGCTGTISTFQITVWPTPTVDPVPNIYHCNGVTTTPVVFTGPVAGTTYTWTNSNPTIGLAAAGSGDVPAFFTTNSGTAPEMALIMVTPSANGCTGIPIPFVIGIYPTPTVDPVSNVIYCNGATTLAIPFTSPVAGTSYAWINSDPSIGLPASGNGTIPSFTATNTGLVPVTATITVTPTANGCVGIPITFTITVNPTATVNPVNNAIYCNGATTTAIGFSGPVSGTTFAWTNSAPSIGLAASGTGDIPSFTATNTGTTPVITTITVTPTAYNCTGTPLVFTIRVNQSLPVSITVSPSANNVCAGTSVTFTAAIVNGGATPLYQWKKGGVNITGATNATYAYVPLNNDVISCQLTSNATCATGTPALSNGVTMQVVPLVPVKAFITASQYNMMPGTSVNFSAAVINGGSNPLYQWKKNGVNIAGATASTYSYSPDNLDKITCVITSNSTTYCLSNNPATSNRLNMVVYVAGTPCSSGATVSHGGATYNTVQIGTQCWLRENLNIGNQIANAGLQTNNSIIEKYCYNDSTFNCDVYGGLYQWNELMQYVTTEGAQGICPTGWHIPTQAEMATFSTFLGGDGVSGGKLKEVGTNHYRTPNSGATNIDGFTALPAGYSYRQGVAPFFSKIQENSYIPTSTQNTSTTDDDYYFRGMIFTGGGLSSPNNYKSTAVGVRCLKNP